MKSSLKALLIVLFFLSPQVRASSIEEIRRLAVDEKQNEHFNESTSLFFKLFSMDPEGPAGNYALSEIRDNYGKSGQLKSAVDEYRADVAGGKQRSADWVEPGGGFFQLLKRPGQLEGFLMKTLQMGGLLAGQSAFLSIVLEQMGFIEEANHYLEEANRITRSVQKEEAERLQEGVGIRPLHYVFPKSYQDANLLPETEDAVHSKKWRRSGPYDSFILLEALNEELNAPYFEVRGGGGLLFDSEPHGFLQNYSFLLGFRTNPLSRWLLGADLRAIYQVPPREDLKDRRFLTYLPGFWASWGASEKTEIRLRYDLSWSPILGDSSTLLLPKRSHGPGLGWAQVLSPRVRFNSLLSREWRSDNSPSKSGTRTSLVFTFFTEVKKNSIAEPFFELGYVRDRADELASRSTEFSFAPGVSLHLKRNLLLHLKPSIYRSSHPGEEEDEVHYWKKVEGTLFWSITRNNTLGVYTLADYAWESIGHWKVGAGLSVGIF